MANADNLTQEGGDRFAARLAMIAVIAESLAEGSDEEIREAFHLPKWRAISPARRARYAEYFAPRVYAAMIAGMRLGLGGGLLDIANFASFEKAYGMGMLYPVIGAGPCVEADIVDSVVTIEEGAGSVNSAPSGTYETGWTRAPLPGEAQKQGYSAQFVGIVGHADLFAVEGLVKLVLIYRDGDENELLREEFNVAGSLLVRGDLVPVQFDHGYGGGLSTRYDLQVTDGAPDVAGHFIPAQPAPLGPYWEIVEIARPFLIEGPAVSWGEIAKYAGALAESVLTPAKVHRVEWDDIPLRAASWANCFPRTKKLCRVDDLVGGVVYDKVKWIGRDQWMLRYDRHYDDLLEAGCVVPQDILGERRLPLRVYAKFDVEFIDDLQPQEP